MGSAYERELKGILSGDPRVLESVVRGCPDEQVLAYRRVLAQPFLVVRAAGSLGTGDLVAMRRDIAFPIEVKAAARDVLHFSESAGKLHEQALELAGACSRSGLIALYAFRRKGVRCDDAWRVFTLPAEGLEGRARILHARLPKVSETAAGVFVLRWAEGMPLHKFIDSLCVAAPPSRVPIAVTA
ncbi:MAG: Holliday junction resolvase [Myxococcota bacterium]